MVSPESSISYTIHCKAQEMTKCYVLATGAALQIQPDTRPNTSFWLESDERNRTLVPKTEFATSAPTLSAIDATSTTQPWYTARSAVSECRTTIGRGRERTEERQREDSEEGQRATQICKTTAISSHDSGVLYSYDLILCMIPQCKYSSIPLLGSTTLITFTIEYPNKSKST